MEQVVINSVALSGAPGTSQASMRKGDGEGEHGAGRNGHGLSLKQLVGLWQWL